MVENEEPDNKQMKSKWKVKCVQKEPGKKTKGLKELRAKKRTVKTKINSESKTNKRSDVTT